MFFSIIVPIYKVEKYIKQCIDSIIHQTYKNFELILVDDGSLDNCPGICDEYAKRDDRIKVIHKQNGGLVSARKAGTEMATGEYIICVDGDDWLEKDYLFEFFNIIDKYNPDIVCCKNYKTFNDGKSEEAPLTSSVGYFEKQKIEQEIYPQLIESFTGHYFSPNICAKAYRRGLYVKNQMSVSDIINIGEDHACTKPCIHQANSLFILDKALYNYRQNDSSMTKNRKAFSWEGPKAIGQHFERQIDMSEFDFQEQVYRNVVHNLFNVCASRFNQKKPYKEIKQEIKKYIIDDYYKNAIEQCKFSFGSKGYLAKVALKTKWIFLIYLYNKKTSK